MTASIDKERRQRVLGKSTTADPDAAANPVRLIRTVRIFTSVAALIGVAVLAMAFSFNEWRTGVVGFVLIILAAVGGAVWVIEAILADRNEFYRRGKVDGWYEGWRGVPPGGNDPLLRAD